MRWRGHGSRGVLQTSGNSRTVAGEGQLKIRDALQHALSIDPNLAAAHHGCRVFMNSTGTGLPRRSEYEHAIAMDPNGIEGGLARKDLLAMEALLTGRFDDWARAKLKRWRITRWMSRSLWFAGWMLCNGGTCRRHSTRNVVTGMDPPLGACMERRRRPCC